MMQLSTRQARVFILATALGSGKQVSATKIISLLKCSEPTLSRVLKELRGTYSAEIKYSKSTHSYQLTQPGTLDKKTLNRMSEALTANEEIKYQDAVSKVILDKEKKKSVSLYLRMSVLRKIDRLSLLSDTNRSNAVEMLVDKCIEDMIRSLPTKKVAPKCED